MCLSLSSSLVRVSLSSLMLGTREREAEAEGGCVSAQKRVSDCCCCWKQKLVKGRQSGPRQQEQSDALCEQIIDQLFSPLSSLCQSLPLSFPFRTEVQLD